MFSLLKVSPARQFYRDEKARDDLWFKDLVRDVRLFFLNGCGYPLIVL